MKRDTSADILLVEDSEDDSAFFAHALKEAGLITTVEVARNGVEALLTLFGTSAATADALPLIRPKLIVLDLKLPKISGLEVLHRLKGNPHTRNIPVVILSSSHEKRDLTDCYAAGVSSYLVKPMDFDDFARLIGTLGSYWLLYNQIPKPPASHGQHTQRPPG